jgi:hypothetical protein
MGFWKNEALGRDWWLPDIFEPEELARIRSFLPNRDIDHDAYLRKVRETAQWIATKPEIAEKTSFDAAARQVMYGYKTLLKENNGWFNIGPVTPAWCYANRKKEALDELYRELCEREIARTCPLKGFYGSDNCDDDCPGWDGRSKRCGCGNRRVHWEVADDFSFEKGEMYVYADIS